MKRKEWVAVIAVMILVAAIFSAVSYGITANTIKVLPYVGRTTFEVYTKAEVNSLLLNYAGKMDYSSCNQISLNEKQQYALLIEGREHTVKLITTMNSNTATLEVDGINKTVKKENNYAFTSGANLYVSNIIHPAYAGDLRQIVIVPISACAGH